MPSIPVYTESPINVARADGITPKTAATTPTQATQQGPNTNPATATATLASASSYATAQQGSPAIPAPTGSMQRFAPVHSASIQPTRTSNINDDGPAPPQPGAFPTPLTTLRGNLPPPPPPKSREKIQFANTHTEMPQPYPPQMGIPPPTTAFGNQHPRSSTSTATSPHVAYPVTLSSDAYGKQQRSLDHPPGYVQDTNASNFSTDQKQAHNSQVSGIMTDNGPDKSDNATGFSVDTESVWNAAKSWASTAGKKLSNAEAEVWKRINGER